MVFHSHKEMGGKDSEIKEKDIRREGGNYGARECSNIFRPRVAVHHCFLSRSSSPEGDDVR